MLELKKSSFLLVATLRDETLTKKLVIIMLNKQSLVLMDWGGARASAVHIYHPPALPRSIPLALSEERMPRHREGMICTIFFNACVEIIIFIFSPRL